LPVEIEARVRRKDGQWRWVAATSANLLEEPDVQAIVLNYRDIGERKAAEEEKQRNVEELARCNEALQAFAFAAAHDLREPLRTVGTFTEYLVQRTRVDDATKEIAGFIVSGVKRMSVLLDDLLSFTKLSVDGPRNRVDLHEVVQRAIHNLAGAIDESAAAVRVGPLPAVEGSETHLVQLFQNLIGNAIKYRSEAAVEICVTAEQAGRELLIKVSDTGIGIAPEYQAQIFDLFKRLHHGEIPGTGMGLAICKKIVEGMGGKIWVESQIGHGSTFCISIPAAESCPYAPPSAARPALETSLPT
jgi:light-regulated signal transduction histidine kinase (bacteriophytochrome)